MTRPGLKRALELAARCEHRTGGPAYVVVTHTGNLEITSRMPLLGEWYSSDGIKHGENPQ